jgi:hypothetical protein
MISEHDQTLPLAALSDDNESWLQHELDEARKTIRSLQRQLVKEQARYNELARAYALTVANLVEATSENMSLERDRNLWKTRAEGTAVPFKLGAGTLDLTLDEVRAMRKAMARLHHPDTGGDSERMKAWNAVLDLLEH